MTALKLAIPSKGRLKEQTEAFFFDCGLRLKQSGGSRGYTAELDGAPDISVLLLSASEIAKGVLSGELHMGITGEDLLREYAETFDEQTHLLKALGFGHARMVVAVPSSWIDVDTIADLEDVGHAFRAQHGRRLRVATKYLKSTRRFFAERGLTQYRLVDSAGATEAAPTSGTAELIVDITTTGATLKANHLKILSDGEMLASEAQLAASLKADWSDPAVTALQSLMNQIEARHLAKSKRILSGNVPLTVDMYPDNEQVHQHGETLILDRKDAHNAAQQLSGQGVGNIAIVAPDFLYVEKNPVFEVFRAKLSRSEQD